MGPPALHQIDACGGDAGMTEHICQLAQVLFQGVKPPGEEMAEVMGEDPPALDTGPPGEGFELLPDIRAVHRLSAFCAEDRPGSDAPFHGIPAQAAAELSGEQDGAELSLTADGGLPPVDGFPCDEAELRDADSGGAKHLHDEQQPEPTAVPGCRQQAEILPAGELPARLPKESSLHLERPHPAVFSAQIVQQGVDSRHFPVDGRHGIALSHKGIPPGDQLGFFQRQGIQPGGKPPGFPEIFLPGGGAVLRTGQPALKSQQHLQRNGICVQGPDTSFLLYCIGSLRFYPQF